MRGCLWIIILALLISYFVGTHNAKEHEYRMEEIRLEMELENGQAS